MAPDGLAPPKAVVGDRPTVQDADGCDYTDWPPTVCIYVFGDEDYVHSWDTSYSKLTYGCHFAGYWQSGTLIATTPTVCGDGPFWGYWEPGWFFADNAQLCNTWSNDSGRPCITISA